MKIRLIAALFVLAVLAVFVSSVWVPPYGGGPEQFVRGTPAGATTVSVKAPTQPASEGRTWVYGLLTDADGQPLPYARIHPTLAEPEPENLSAFVMATTDVDGRFAVELPHARWDWWFEGGPNRRDAGSTALGTFEFSTAGAERLDLQLPGEARLLGELQMSGDPGLVLDCDLVDATGERVARGDAVSGGTLLARVSSEVRAKFSTSMSIGVVRGTGLCFEGVPAGKYTLRAFLNREHELVHEVPIELVAGEVLELGRIGLDLGDFDEGLAGAELLPAD